ncbi:von Willebrand factor A domain-containing protein 5A-like [Pholidichthys leucotaenia]
MAQCGLLTANKQPVPLKSIDVELEVNDHVATVVSTLNYKNNEDKPIEAVFVFPLPGDATMCHFSAEIGQTQILAEVKEKEKVCDEYDTLSSDQQESEQSQDIFTLSVGSLLPGETASIRLEYVTELSVEADDGLRFCLPAVLNPRYQPQGSKDRRSGNVQVTSVPSSSVPYSLSFSARVFSSHPVFKIQSNCCLDPLQYLNTDQTQAKVKLAAGHKFDRDIELLIHYKDVHKPTVVMEAGQCSAELGSLMADPVVMVSLYLQQSSSASCGEFVFLMDRSGSMQGSKIKSARDTLLLLLKSLPMGCYFNIYSFGSNYEHMFLKSVEYSKKTMEEALKKVEQMDADLGGTEILKPLNHIYSQPLIPNQTRQLFVFTDGAVGDTNQVIDLVKKNSSSHKCFSFGIGNGASADLINGMAKEGGGQAQFVTETDSLEPKVMQSLRCGLQLRMTDISVTWDLPEGVSATVLSQQIPELFPGERTLIFAQITGLKPSSKGADGYAIVKYRLAGHLSEEKLHFSLKRTEDTRLTVHRLGALTLIRSLEMKESENGGSPDEAVKKKIVDLSVQSGVSSIFTSFTAVNKKNGKAIEEPLLRRAISSPSNKGGVRCRPNSGVRRRPNTSKKPSRDFLLQLVSLQEASGCWLLNPSLAAVVGKSIKEMENSKPERVNDEVWATILALIWLHGFNKDSEVEWVLLAAKAVSWLRAQNAPNATECADAGNSLLGCNVRKGALGISLVVQEPVDKAAVPQDGLYLSDEPCYILLLIVLISFFSGFLFGACYF